jgi:hypothetical protein
MSDPFASKVIYPKSFQVSPGCKELVSDSNIKVDFLITIVAVGGGRRCAKHNVNRNEHEHEHAHFYFGGVSRLDVSDGGWF